MRWSNAACERPYHLFSDQSGRQRRLPAWTKAAGAILAVAALGAGSLFLYLAERGKPRNTLEAGPTAAATRVDNTLNVQRIDAATREVSAQYQIEPTGQLADEAGQLTTINADSFFQLTKSASTPEAGVTVLATEVARSTATFAFALFVMVFMWGLAVAAVVAAWFVVGGRKGLLWPSMSFMAALLFALVPLRNALPGGPPIGSVVDFCAFFLVETLISASLITTVITGFIQERRTEAAARPEPEPIPRPPAGENPAPRPDAHPRPSAPQPTPPPAGMNHTARTEPIHLAAADRNRADSGPPQRRTRP
ncbi:DUF4436 family protein [Actinokineospora iranica]|uniref:DUF4436 domain-containing protein n=1 Tax=Actinokineospora iranica TaxID=1271860 RepID=A0A1G6ZCJ0_9PSEU|nr:DUF4436 family protein [Actinokineospora iranica]SDE00310.1 protein of unknown function [Actinokineospora iranica]